MCLRIQERMALFLTLTIFVEYYFIGYILRLGVPITRTYITYFEDKWQNERQTAAPSPMQFLWVWFTDGFQYALASLIWRQILLLLLRSHSCLFFFLVVQFSCLYEKYRKQVILVFWCPQGEFITPPLCAPIGQIFVRCNRVINVPWSCLFQSCKMYFDRDSAMADKSREPQCN